MIKQVYSSGRYLDSYTDVPNYISGNTPDHDCRAVTGDMRYNTYNHQVEVYDGYSWTALASCSHVQLTQNAEEALDWVREKMQEEAEERALLEKNPALKKMRDKYKMMLDLSREHKNEYQT